MNFEVFQQLLSLVYAEQLQLFEILFLSFIWKSLVQLTTEDRPTIQQNQKNPKLLKRRSTLCLSKHHQDVQQTRRRFSVPSIIFPKQYCHKPQLAVNHSSHQETQKPSIIQEIGSRQIKNQFIIQPGPEIERVSTQIFWIWAKKSSGWQLAQRNPTEWFDQLEFRTGFDFYRSSSGQLELWGTEVC